MPVFSYLGDASQHPQQVPCWITHTNERTHEIIRSGFDRSPMFTGKIEGVGPRYCPSVEDKINRFADKDSHQIFLEPEGLTTHEYYPNGISTSLPFDIQYDLVRSMKGLENAHIIRPGYAIEYDFFDPRQLRHSLETRAIGGLFFAGQINGTTGYEEAAAQGLFAGINAALQHRTIARPAIGGDGELHRDGSPKACLPSAFGHREIARLVQFARADRWPSRDPAAAALPAVAAASAIAGPSRAGAVACLLRARGVGGAG